MHKKQCFAVVFLSFILLSCNSSSDTDKTDTVITEETIYVNHYKTHCTTGPNGLCLRTKTDKDDTWDSDVDGIHDFHYEWGHRYKLLIRKEKVETGPDPTGNWTDYFLLDVLEDSIVEPNTLFTLVVDERGNTELMKVEENLYRYGYEKLVTCKPADCSVIDTLEDQQLEILIEVTYQESVDDPLLITQILCTAPAGQVFDRDCLHQ